MSNRKNILYELEISCTILKTSINALAGEWNVSHTHVREVAKGNNQSARIYRLINQTISEAQKKVSFQTDPSAINRKREESLENSKEDAKYGNNTD